MTIYLCASFRDRLQCQRSGFAGSDDPHEYSARLGHVEPTESSRSIECEIRGDSGATDTKFVRILSEVYAPEIMSSSSLETKLGKPGRHPLTATSFTVKLESIALHRAHCSSDQGSGLSLLRCNAHPNLHFTLPYLHLHCHLPHRSPHSRHSHPRHQPLRQPLLRDRQKDLFP